MDTVPERRPQRWTSEKVESFTQWSPTLASIRSSKPEGFRFMPGHYARLGLATNGSDPVWRPYSIVSAPAEDFLEFLVTLVPGGTFTSQLAGLQASAELMVDSAVMGFFLPDQLAPGDSLWMLATGSGFGPYVSMLREGGVLRKYRKIVAVHSVRCASELAYREELEAFADQNKALHYVPVVTRQSGYSLLTRRIPELVARGALEALVDTELHGGSGRVMVCGNPAFTTDMRQLLSQRGFQPCRRGMVGSMLFEKYW